MFVYVAGPYSRGDMVTNVRNAMEAGHKLMDLGVDTFIPHLSHFLDMHRSRPYNQWLDMDLRIIPRCDAIFLLPGVSPGAEKECALAGVLGIPVYTTYEDVKTHLNGIKMGIL